MGLDGAQRRDEPLRRTCTGTHILRQESLASLADIKHDGAGFEYDEVTFLEYRHLPEGLYCAIIRRVLIALIEQARAVWEACLLQRPAGAQIAHVPLREGRDRFESRDGNHAQCSFAISAA